MLLLEELQKAHNAAYLRVRAHAMQENLGGELATVHEQPVLRLVLGYELDDDPFACLGAHALVDLREAAVANVCA